MHELIDDNKTAVISVKVLECDTDTQKLYSLIQQLTNSKPDNPFPPGKTDLEVANDYADFHINKIEKIREDLSIYPTYDPNQRHIDAELFTYQFPQKWSEKSL